jgi:hypothetical protein
MLHGLFGNQNVTRILLFLFVNEKCYASQIQSLLRVPLTPIQKALLRLEKEGIVHSHHEGKVRIYLFNPDYPLQNELAMLLKKAYTLLSPQEKKGYCFIHKPRLLFGEEVDRERTRKSALLVFWERLKKVRHLSFSAKSRQEDKQNIKVGQAEVQISSPGPSIIVFQEKGHWFHDQLPETVFSNSFRWTLDLNASLITLEHLRYGVKQPVFLFHLTPTQPCTLESVDAHLCGNDTYLGSIVWTPSQIDFHWRIIGPYKNDQLLYHYT